jgi:sec-independent protein translocase protein TatC
MSKIIEPYDTPPEETEKAGMPFLEHLEELRWRIIKSILAVIVMAVIAFIYAEEIYRFITVPLGDVKLHYTDITGSFGAYMRIAIYAGIVGALPIILYQIWKFIAPGLYAKEKKVILLLVFISTLLFLTGASFCFYLVLPFAIKFLVGYGAGEMIPIITITSYISFTGMMLLAFGLSFELPIVGYFFGRIGLLSAKTLRRVRPYAIIIILIAAGVLTPTPDIFSQLLLAVPLYILYEITILIVALTGRKKENIESKE